MVCNLAGLLFLCHHMLYDHMTKELGRVYVWTEGFISIHPVLQDPLPSHILIPAPFPPARAAAGVRWLLVCGSHDLTIEHTWMYVSAVSVDVIMRRLAVIK